MRRLRAFTFIELMIVLAIILMLVSGGFVQYLRVKEDALNRQARSTLQLLRTAQRRFHLRNGSVFYGGGTLAQINQNLEISIPPDPRWEYSVFDTGCCQAVRVSASGVSGQSWHILATGEDASVSSGECP